MSISNIVFISQKHLSLPCRFSLQHLSDLMKKALLKLIMEKSDMLVYKTDITP